MKRTKSLLMLLLTILLLAALPVQCMDVSPIARKAQHIVMRNRQVATFVGIMSCIIGATWSIYKVQEKARLERERLKAEHETSHAAKKPLVEKPYTQEQLREETLELRRRILSAARRGSVVTLQASMEGKLGGVACTANSFEKPFCEKALMHGLEQLRETSQDSVVTYLLAARKDLNVNIQAKKGKKTLLMLATEQINIPLVESLLERRAYIWTEDALGVSAEKFAQKLKNEQITPLFAAERKKQNDLDLNFRIAVVRGNIAQARAMHAQGANPQGLNVWGQDIADLVALGHATDKEVIAQNFLRELGVKRIPKLSPFSDEGQRPSSDS